MKSKSELLKVAQSALAPIKKISVSEWADNFRVISDGNAEPGRWRTSRTPYTKAVMDAFTEKGINRVVAMFASQTGKSEVLQNVIGRFAHLDPAPIMLVQPTVDMGEKFSKTRIAGMIRDTRVLRERFYEKKDSPKSRDSNQTILSKFFPGGHLLITGANSPATLASQPIRILLCDEVDRFPESAGVEGDPVSIAAKRTTTFWNRIIGLFSTPTTEGASRIETEYLMGTREEWRHACPNCGEYHKLEHTDMFTDSERKVRWRCPDCGMDHGEVEMKNAPQKYVAQNPKARLDGIRSFWVNAFSSPWLNWRDILQEWSESKGDPAREKVVMNTRFAKSYHEVGEYEDENVFLARLEDYDAELPSGVKVLTAAVDVQANRLEYEIVGWGAGEERWGILRGIVYGSPNELSTWNNLAEILDRDYRFADGNTLKVARTFVDSGFCTKRVYDFCFSRRTNTFPIKGLGGKGIPLLHKYTPQKDPPVILAVLGVDDGKQEVFARLGVQEVGKLYMHFPRDDFLLGSRGYNETYFKQLIAEKRVIKWTKGVSHLAWEPVAKHARNESLDLAVYSLAAMKSLNIDWDKFSLPNLPSETQTSAPRPPRRNIVSRTMEIF